MSNKTIEDIISLNKLVKHQFSNVYGWGPDEAAEILCRSRLDWLVSLSETLMIWDDSNSITDGRLILAWANLGSLLESSMKLFLAVYKLDYDTDPITKKCKEERIVEEPDIVELNKLREFFKRKKLINIQQNDYILQVQQRRNAIHSFKTRNIGTHDEFVLCVEKYKNFIEDIYSRLPER